MHKIKNTLAITSMLLSSFLMSCGDDEVTPSITVDEPATYAFTRNGSSSVSFSGQATRIAMAEELISALKTSSLTATSLSAMFDHQEGANDFSNSDLNASNKNIKSKVAASSDLFSSNSTDASAIKADFDAWISAQANDVFPNWSVDATKGVAGAIQEAGGGSTRYVNANGLEYNQAVAKSLIGGLMADQTLNNYLGTAVLDEASNRVDQEAGTVVDGKTYAAMEHKWDEAFGYVYGASQDAANPNATIGSDDSFLNKYIGRVEGDTDFAGIAADIFNAFKRGRAAIVAGDYTARDAQAAIIRQKVSEVIAIRSVYYLQQGKAALEATTPDMASAFHDLSEGFGFVYSLQFTRNPLANEAFFTRTEVEGFIANIYPTASQANGFWDVTPANLQTVSEAIAAKFSFTVDKAGS